jgi:hypothetical protein
MTLGKLADVREYEEARKANIRHWAPFVLYVDRQGQRPGESDLRFYQRKRHFDVIANQAIWAVTEISSDVRWKYLAQPYISEEVKQRWDTIGTAAPMIEYVRDLRHEHVFVRARLVKDLRSAEDLAAVEEVLGNAVSCVCTKIEDDRLNKTGTGWGRYGCPRDGNPIRVWDRLNDCWLDYAALIKA